MRVAVVNGPNLNLLGTREPEVYGADTLDDLEHQLDAIAQPLGVSLTFFQSNHEGALIDFLHGLIGQVDAIVINPAGLTHTSVALRDALSSIAIPVYEVHISNIHQREAFRHHSYVSGVATAVFCGAGLRGYEYALREARARHGD